MSNYVYIPVQEGTMFAVGFYDPANQWHDESLHASKEEAAKRVSSLNGCNLSEVLESVNLLLRHNSVEIEMLRGQLKEAARVNAELEGWKREKLAVDSQCDWHKLARLLGIPLGQSINSNLFPCIQNLLEDRDNHRIALEVAKSAKDRLESELALAQRALRLLVHEVKQGVPVLATLKPAQGDIIVEAYRAAVGQGVPPSNDPDPACYTPCYTLRKINAILDKAVSTEQNGQQLTAPERVALLAGQLADVAECVKCKRLAPRKDMLGGFCPNCVSF